MNCSPFDLRDYFLRELPDPQQRQVEAHVKLCQPCREELDRLRVTEAPLMSLREEEIPQRIAFVSDKIFEPSPVRRWFAGFWGSAARLGFASAAMLSTAIVIYAFHPVKQPPQPVAAIVQPAPIAAPAVSDTEIQARIDSAVTKAVARVELRQAEKAQYLKAELENMRKNLILEAAALEMDQKRASAAKLLGSAYGPPSRREEQQ